MLFDERFHLKLCDFSSAKIIEPGILVRNRSFVGTPEYIPPELLKEEGVGKM